ncbi:MAG: hypothetical protein ACK5NN_05135 [Sphingomonadaceae bacterium]
MDIVDFISLDRLKTYENHTDSQKKAVALHNHTLQLGASLMSMIALIELSLRNSTNQRLIADFGDDEWLLPGHATVPLKQFERSAISKAYSLAQKSAYSKLNYKQKNLLDAFAFPCVKPSGTNHRAEVKKRQELFVASHGQVISQTTISFWKRLYSSDYHDDLWKPSLKKVFPNKSLKRSDISNSLEVIYTIRNRVAHHEPVYGKRLDDAMSAINFVRNSLGARKNEEDSNFKKFSRVHHLRLRMDFENFIEAWHTLT